MVLHTINSAPGNSAFTDCLRLAAAEDAILLVGDGVYAALAHTDACSGLLKSGIEVYVLASDAQAAGISSRIDSHFSLRDFDGFVALTERFPRQLAWS
jgi:tRNA 2-thiouridine synthesizing protein B